MRGLDRAPREASDTTGPRPTDWVVGVVIVLAHLTRVRAGQVEDVVPAGWAELLSQASALGAGVAVVWRRSRRRGVAVTVLVCFVGLVLVEGIVPAWAPWVVIWTLATTGPDRRRSTSESSVVVGVTLAVLGAGQVVHPRSGGFVLVAAVTAVVALLGVLVRSERSRLEEARRRATIEERLRIARDLHDLVGHGLSAVAVQSSAARMALAAGDIATTERALTAVESTSRTAMREMRQMLNLLSDQGEASTSAPVAAAVGGQPAVTDPDPPRQPSPGVSDIAALVENVRAGGVTVTLEDDGRWGAAAPAAQLCAYRVAQEGLTNAVRHAPSAPVTIRLSALGEEGHVSVLTAGPAAAASSTAHGRGLAGLATRVAALSGEFWSGPTPQGWLLEARLPMHDTPGQR